ncbi:MAG: histidine triad nucleotide-binding protein [bacterium]|nr:histidine triad nucleotide-binding protein [bacterium]
MCIFCKIINKEIPAEIVFEDKDVLAFKDIHPIAPIHILIIPKKHIDSINDLEERDIELVGKMIFRAKEIAKSFDIFEKGYKLLIRTGEWGGQEVPHIHLHLIGGAKLSEDIRPII